MLNRRLDLSKLVYFHVEEGVESTCMIPMTPEVQKVVIDVRCSRSVRVNVVNTEGETIPMLQQSIVHWSGRVENLTAVEIVADTSFWYLCQKQGGWFETVDPTPMVVELVQTKEDVLKNMIEERLRQYAHQMHMDRVLTEDEKDELILDIARGDLEFDETPDEFGLGYEERLAEFTRGEPFKPTPEAEVPAEEEEGETPPKPAAKPAVKPQDSSST